MTEWGPWIEHDGQRPKIRWGDVLQIKLSSESGSIMPENAVDDLWPGFFWEWKTVGGFMRRQRTVVCHDPSYVPIIGYRVRRDRSAVLERLRGIAADPSQKVSGPVGPQRQAKPANANGPWSKN